MPADAKTAVDQEMKRLRIARDTSHAIAAVAFLVIFCLIGGLVVSGGTHHSEMLKLKNEHAKALADQARYYESRLAGSPAQTQPDQDVAP